MMLGYTVRDTFVHIEDPDLDDLRLTAISRCDTAPAQFSAAYTCPLKCESVEWGVLNEEVTTDDSAASAVSADSDAESAAPSAPVTRRLMWADLEDDEEQEQEEAREEQQGEWVQVCKTKPTVPRVTAAPSVPSYADVAHRAHQHQHQTKPHTPARPQHSTSTESVHQCYFPVQIADEPGFKVVKRIIGPGGKFMKNIAYQSNAKLRLRGCGSGFKEKETGMEGDHPLQLHVSADSPEQLERAKTEVDKLFRKIYRDYDAYERKQGRAGKELQVSWV